MSCEIAIHLIVLLTVVLKCEGEVCVVPIEFHFVLALVPEPIKIPCTLERYTIHVCKQHPNILLSKSSALGTIGTERKSREDVVQRARKRVAICASPLKFLLCASVRLRADEGYSGPVPESDKHFAVVLPRPRFLLLTHLTPFPVVLDTPVGRFERFRFVSPNATVPLQRNG
jgi:hypothetical protein